MDLSKKVNVWVRPDDVSDPVTSTRKLQDGSPNHCCGPRSLQNQSSSKNVRLRMHPYSSSKKAGNNNGVVRQASNDELQQSSPRKPHLERVPEGKIPLVALNSNQRRTEEPKPVKLRRYHTDSSILALRAELKRETGVTPKTPEKDDNPFEPSDLPEKMARPWLSPSMFGGPAPATSSGFKWSIDHMATLLPVEISHRDILHTEYLKHVQTESDEENAQTRIIQFFGDPQLHLLSPTSASGAASPLHFFRGESEENSDEEHVEAESKAFTKHRVMGVETKEVSCQTDVHISPSFNFEKYLADYQVLTRYPSLRERSGSVRRRLFDDLDEMRESSVERMMTSPVRLNVSMGFQYESPRDFSSLLSSGFGDGPSHTDVEMSCSPAQTNSCDVSLL